MKRIIPTIVYVVFVIASLVMASGAPAVFSGSGGGG